MSELPNQDAKYNVRIDQGQGIAIGQNASVTNITGDVIFQIFTQAPLAGHIHHWRWCMDEDLLPLMKAAKYLGISNVKLSQLAREALGLHRSWTRMGSILIWRCLL